MTACSPAVRWLIEAAKHTATTFLCPKDRADDFAGVIGLREALAAIESETATITPSSLRPQDHRETEDPRTVRIRELEAAIQRALADAESGNGWGPDVTVCAYLRTALGGKS